MSGVAVSVSLAEAGHLGYWNNDDDFYVRLSYMVDFDQKRATTTGIPGLPGDGGMYCVPTSASNLMAYIDRHGYANNPFIDGPGLLDWTSSSTAVYNAATAYIDAMGDDMNTDPDDGTNNDNNQIRNAVRDRLNPLFFDVNYYARTDTWCPKAINIAKYMAQGGIVSFCYGRWNIDASGEGLSSRDSGHCITMTKVDKRAFMNYDDWEYVINYADPGSGGSSEFSQSDFAYRVETVEDFNYFVIQPGVYRRMSRIMFQGLSDDRHRIIDSAMAVFPKAGWAVYPTPNSMTFYTGSFVAGDGPGGVGLHTFQMPGEIGGCEVSPDRGFASVVTEPEAGGPAVLYHVDVMTGQTTPIASFAHRVPALTHHRDRTVLLAVDGDSTSPGQIRRYEMDTDLPSGSPRLEWSVNLPMGTSVVDLAFNDANDTLAALADTDGDGDADSIIDYGMDDDRIFPEGTHEIPAGSICCMESIDFDPDLGEYLVTDHEGGLVVRFATDAASGRLIETGRLALGAPIDGCSMGDGGRLYVLAGGVVSEWDTDGAGGFAPTADPSPMAGLPALRDFQISRSRTNFVAALHSGPQWNNFDPSELAPVRNATGECPADIAAPFELLDLADINAFVTGFLAQDPIADVNADGLFDLQDVTLFINSFLAGCP
ncbi:MAG: hypothetical protein H6810_00640 [Phycisphaeraceae bacterium]|nr:MAG: hypothetical protein H6810_00640 [Phycisphaeraceae bacterium]